MVWNQYIPIQTGSPETTTATTATAYTPEYMVSIPLLV